MLVTALVVVAALQDPPPSAQPLPRPPTDLEFRAQIQAFGPRLPPATVDAGDLRSIEQATALDPRLGDDEFVVGLTIGEEARAWPIEVLSHAEVLNDDFAGIPIAITWCSMCQTAVVYRRTVGEQVLTLGNSRATLHHNLLIYDLETGSYWQQVSGEAVHGALAGRVLEQLPTVACTWAGWKRDHPRTRVLLDEMPAIKNRNRFHAFHEGALQYMGLAAQIGRAVRYYPLGIVAERGLVEDVLADVPLVVVYDREQRVVRAWRRPGGKDPVQLTLERTETPPTLTLAERDGPGRWSATTGEPLGDAADAAPLEPIVATPISSGRFKRLFPNATRFGPPRPRDQKR